MAAELGRHVSWDYSPMPELAYINGTFCELDQAKVSVEDRGFLFADGVYEVVVAFGGRCFRLAEHLVRLKNSLDGIGLPFDLQKHRIQEVIQEGVARCGFDPAMVYLQITRGAAPRRLAYDDGMEPTVVATFKAKPEVDPALRARGLSLMTVPEIRWAHCHIKSVALLPNSMVKNDAVRRGYDDALFVADGDEVREGTASNVFAVCDGVLVTPPKTGSILHGVTRSHLLECARELNVPFAERRLTVETLMSAAEVMICSTTVDVIGVTRVNDQPIGDGLVGPATCRLYEQFEMDIAGRCA
ncbi:MAG: aminotransferase class IV [Phycisphaerae bacterium]